ncbi:MAG: prolipoprotein diacylglyceryl transferase [Candidatus Moranbacteria bacterium]|nr:prolipoprotein diacylglyceryl transferase [Candidatus Moranbacteria bacterium]
MIEFWQNLPYYLDPVIFQINGFKVSWYWLMYVVGFFVVTLLVKYRIKKRGIDSQKAQLILDALFWMFLGLIIGARLGYVLFYNLGFYLADPLAIINPFVLKQGQWVYQGIYGMSYHGGMIGVIISLLIYTRIKNIGFLKTADFIIPAIPLGFFFGRIGNFLNGELYGRITESKIGMYFPNALYYDQSAKLRHPSQLYEAFFEGIILFIILWILRNKIKVAGLLSALYLIFYAIFRFFIEFFRQPDFHLGFVLGSFSMGQVLSILMFVLGLTIFIFQIIRNNQLRKINH